MNKRTMINLAKKIILLLNMVCTILFMLLPWMRVEGIKEENGLIILSGNVVLSVIILCVYFMSVVFIEKHKGRFSNTLPGPYLGLICVLMNLLVFILLNYKNNWHKI